MYCVQVFESTPNEFLQLIRSESDIPMQIMGISVVRMQGLPYRCNEDDIVRRGGRGSEGVKVYRRCEG